MTTIIQLRSVNHSKYFDVVCRRSKKEDELNINRKTFSRNVRPIPIRILSVGKSRNAGASFFISHYSTKISRYCNFQEIQIRPNPKNSPEIEVQVEAEAERVLRSIGSNDWVVILDERGVSLTSEMFSALIGKVADSSSNSLIFCVGGPYGHGSGIRKRANQVVTLSSMVLNHELALVVLMEQIYRGWTILKGEKYHH